MRPDHLFLARGSALLLVLWSLVLLSMSVFGVVEIVQSSVLHASHLELESQARALALSGLAIGLNPNIQEDSSLLEQQPEEGQKWSVSFQGEAARLNLNFVLLSGHREIITRLLASWGVKPADAAHVAACLYDWVTPGTDPSPGGAKAADYRQAGRTRLPTGKPFATLEEASQVIGMDLVEKAKPDWRNSLTLWSEGPLDVNETSADLLAVLFGVPLEQAASFVKGRDGPDKIPGTADDVPVPDGTALASRLGISADAMTSLANEVVFAEKIRRIQSRGESNHVAVNLSVIARLYSQPPAYLLWNED